MKSIRSLLLAAACAAILPDARADIGLISPIDAKALIEAADPAKGPVVLAPRGGSKDSLRGHIPLSLKQI